MPTPQARISKIDQAIDAVTRELRRRERIRPMSAASWQAAWDRQSALHDEYSALFYRRGFWQLIRDKHADALWQEQRRSERAKRAAALRKAGS